MKIGKIKIIDYDQAGLFWRDYEIARAMFMICYNYEHSDEYNLKKIFSFLDGYKKSLAPMDIKFGIELFLFSSSNSLYCYEKWNTLSQSKKEYAFYRNKMITWINNNKNSIINNYLEKKIDIDR